MSAPGSDKGFDGWKQLINNHIQRYPAMTARDVYKLLYQGILGPEHIMPSPEIFTARLKADLNDLRPDSSQPLLEEIRPDKALQRIHLRPWLASGQELVQLLPACLETGMRSWGTHKQLVQTWRWFLEQMRRGEFASISETEAMAFDAFLKEHDYPAAHHSTVYEESYTPAYRLVGRDLLIHP